MQVFEPFIVIPKRCQVCFLPFEGFLVSEEGKDECILCFIRSIDMSVQLQIAEAFLNKSSYSGSVTSKRGWLVNRYLLDKRFSLDLGCSFCCRIGSLGYFSCCSLHGLGCFFWGNITRFFLSISISIRYNQVSFSPRRKQYVWVCRVVSVCF